MKEYKKHYLIDERGVVYDKQTMEPTRDIQIIQNHYYLKGKPIHRIVYELYKGSIPRGYCIYHQNLCSFDNRPQNLILLSCYEHIKLHGELKRDPQKVKQLKKSAVLFYYKQYKSSNQIKVFIPRKCCNGTRFLKRNDYNNYPKKQRQSQYIKMKMKVLQNLYKTS